MKDLSETKPIAGLLEPLDVGLVAKRMDLESRGEQNGRRNVPSSDQRTPDVVEQEILQLVSVTLTTQKTALLGTLKALRDNVASLSVSSELTQLKLVARDASARFVGARAEIGGELAQLRREFIDAERELKQFRLKNNLDRPARRSGSMVLSISLLVFLTAIESIVNGVFFAKGSELGVIGGVGIAIGISVANIWVSYFVGYIPARYINHRRWELKLIGLCITGLVMGLIMGLHLFSAHYRDAMGRVGETDAMASAVRGVLSAPYALHDVTSYSLFGLGVLLAWISFWKGYAIQDPYPGYGPMSRRAYDAALRYDDAYRELFGQLEEVREDAVTRFRTALGNIPQQFKLATSAMSQRAALIQGFSVYEQHLEQSANRLLSIYRQANRAARTTPAPTRFDEDWRLPSSTLSDSDLLLIGSGDLDTSVTADSALTEISNLQTELLQQYENLVSQADRPSDLMERLGQ